MRRRNGSNLFYILAVFVVFAAIIYQGRDRIAQNTQPYVEELKEQLSDMKEEASEENAEAPSEGSETAVEAELSGPYTVLYVVDGDTLNASIDGEDVRIRFLGVDTPESVNPDPARNCEEGKTASNYTKNLIPEGSQIWLEYDQEHTDKYDRVLAYVYLSDVYSLENTAQYHLLADGMAHCMPIKPNTKYQNEFATFEETARQNAAGFWETDFWN